MFATNKVEQKVKFLLLLSVHDVKLELELPHPDAEDHGGPVEHVDHRHDQGGHQQEPEGQEYLHE